jgi:heme oxygenase (staphylobilin-producing)
MFVVTNELVVDEEHREQFESIFPESMRATLPGVPGLLRASLLAPTESGQGHLAILEFSSQEAFQAYLHSEAFRAAHPWSGRVPLASNTLTTYTVHTDLVGTDLTGTPA